MDLGENIFTDLWLYNVCKLQLLYTPGSCAGKTEKLPLFSPQDRWSIVPLFHVKPICSAAQQHRS